MKVKVLFLLLIISLTFTVLPCYGEEGNDSSDSTKHEKIVEDLKSDNEEVRDNAIDELILEVLESLEVIVDKAEVDKSGTIEEEHSRRIKILMKDTLDKVSKQPREQVKEAFKDILDSEDSREIIAPFMGVFLEIMQAELDKKIDQMDNKVEEDNKDTQE